MDKESKPPFLNYDEDTQWAYVILLGRAEEEIAMLKGKEEALRLVISHLKELLQADETAKKGKNEKGDKP